jgi:hypothetical protein
MSTAASPGGSSAKFFLRGQSSRLDARRFSEETLPVDSYAAPTTPVDDAPYIGAPVVGAALGTIFFPLLSLIAALVLQGSTTSPQKKAQLRMWAWISGGWLAAGLLIFIMALVAFGVFASAVVDHAHSGFGPNPTQPGRSGSPCRGGPQMSAIATPIPGTNKYVFPCRFGGTTTVVITGMPGH